MQLECLCIRFPLVGERILNNLDGQSLANIKKASPDLAKYLENERFYWIRIIKKYTKNFKEFEESWKEVINKTPVDVLKQLGIAVQKCFKSYHFVLWHQLAPIDIALMKG